MKHLKILLLQARRTEDPMRHHELTCFAKQCRLEPEQVVPYDLLQGPPGLEEVRRYDALMVGGAGDYYVSKENLPGFSGLIDLFGEIAASGHPTFASCFGYHCLVSALGGEIAYEPEQTEVGTYALTLTDEGRSDALFGVLPSKFWAQEGHKDQTRQNPDGIANLASSERSPMQALRIPNQPIWATQFHPELNRETNLDRFRHYLEGYVPHMSAQQRREAVDRFRESPETSRLLPQFLQLVFG